MRLLICAGGTGGGVYPALSVLKQLISMMPESETLSSLQAGQASGDELQVLWVGGEGGMEEHLVKREGLRFESIPAAGVHGVGIRTLPGNLWQLCRGFFASRHILRKFHPDVLFFTGGYVAVPMALAGRLSSRIKSVLYVPDIEPGLALKTIARFSDYITLTVDESMAFFPARQKKEVTGYPLRSGLNSWTKDEARSFFALQDELPVLLVLGGSRGAHSINQALFNSLPELLKNLQVIHITGNLDWEMVERIRVGISTDQLSRYRPYPYLHDEIGAAMSLADLALTRAGASILGELPAVGLPAILVPYPYAWRYQRVNAGYLVKRGAAVYLDDSQLAGQIIPLVRDLLGDSEKLARMSDAMRSLARPEAAARIASIIKKMATPPLHEGPIDVPNASG